MVLFRQQTHTAVSGACRNTPAPRREVRINPTGPDDRFTTVISTVRERLRARVQTPVDDDFGTSRVCLFYGENEKRGRGECD